MHRTHFSSDANHVLQHRVALNVTQEGLGLARNGQVPQVRDRAAELAHWFAKHIQSLDAALALHIRRHSIGKLAQLPAACYRKHPYPHRHEGKTMMADWVLGSIFTLINIKELRVEPCCFVPQRCTGCIRSP